MNNKDWNIVGKNCLITGATSGIGKETALSLARMGANVIFTSRDEKNGEKTKMDIVNETKNSNVNYLICDLSSFRSIRELTEEFKKKYERLDVLINNAGVLPQEREVSKDGIELNFAVNFLAPFLLTKLLLPLLKQSSPSRVINVSSSMHTEGEIDFEDLESAKSFDKYKAYSQSKLALILFTKKLAKDLRGSGVTVNALHPGVVDTEMTMKNVRKMNPIASFFFKRTLISSKEGAETSVYLASSPLLVDVTGKYFVNKEINNAHASTEDTVLREKIWLVAEKYTRNFIDIIGN
ncbi:MAG: hypothetical protein LiPW30_49 [Parcubacteria group bacterium LiPW_30]|nr:MAG: hypothetical protein LiPW30_49 [Parcubacteria group bacterium LiPW_30]